MVSEDDSTITKFANDDLVYSILVLQVGTRASEHEIYDLTDNRIYKSCIQAALRALRTVDTRIHGWEFNPYEVVPHLKKIGLITVSLPSAND